MEEAEQEAVENAMDVRITDRERDRRTLHDDAYSDSEDEGDGRRDQQNYKLNSCALGGRRRGNPGINNSSSSSLLHDFSKNSSAEDLSSSQQDSMEVDL